MKIGIIRETFPGERRVAMVPKAMDVLAKSGVEFIVEASAGLEAGFRDQEYSAKGARVEADRAACDRGRRCDFPGAHARRQPRGRPRGPQLVARRACRNRILRSVDRSPRMRGFGGARRNHFRHGVDAAHHQGAEHGRIVVDGDSGRLSRRAAGCRSSAAFVSDAHDRGRNHRAGAGFRAGCGRGRPAGDRHSAASGCGGKRLRFASGGARAGGEFGREVCPTDDGWRRAPKTKADTPRRWARISTANSGT